MPHHYSYHTGIFKKYNGRLQVFEEVMYHLESTKILNYVLISQKEKIQQAMEKRALHKILCSLLDPHFTWE
jgi:hypothetical protein